MSSAFGHYGDSTTDLWSTPQGGFEPPLQVTGVQHPAPPLSLTLQRTTTGIAVSAPFAIPVLNGVPVQPFIPASTMWVLLYAQAEQVDGQDKRNILLDCKQAAVRTQKDVGVSTNAYGEAVFPVQVTTTILKDLGFIANAPAERVGSGVVSTTCAAK